MAKKDSPSRPDYQSPSFRGALTRDHFEIDTDPERSTIPTAFLADLSRVGDAVKTISRLLHNSLSEPSMSGAEPLGEAAHLGLLNALEVIGDHVSSLEESMRQNAADHVALMRMAREQGAHHD